jgi:predicted aminopeptidase
VKKGAGAIAALGPGTYNLARRGILQQQLTLPFGAPRTMFNVPIAGARRCAAQSWPIERFLADPALDPKLKAQLERAVRIRDYASRELGLPDNRSYRSYADLARPFVVWNVFAAAEFSVEPKQWCFPFAGCVGYRGYFSKADADAFAAGLRTQGFDVHVGGVPAYSTLGWFDDPFLNTFINYPDYELARLIFHELAHQVAYVKGDSEFNESFAVAVEIEGVERWIRRHGDAAMSADAARARQRRLQFSGLVIEARERLKALYALRIAPDVMRERKVTVFAELRNDYSKLRQSWGGYAGYDRFFENINNANLASFSIYKARLPDMQRLLARKEGDLAAFYAEIQRLAGLSKTGRDAELAAP